MSKQMRFEGSVRVFFTSYVAFISVDEIRVCVSSNMALEKSVITCTYVTFKLLGEYHGYAEMP